MSSVYDVLRRRCGLTQLEAADLRGVRLDSVKSWCSGRRPAPAEAVEELRELETAIARAGAAYARLMTARQLLPDERGPGVYVVSEPSSEQQAHDFGWPCASVCLAAIAAAIAGLPPGADIRMLEQQEYERQIPRASKNDHLPRRTK